MGRDGVSGEPGPVYGDGPVDRVAVDRLLAALAADEDLLARFSAPLWARVGRPVGLGDLQWVRGLFGDQQAPDVVLRALVREGILPENTPSVIKVEPLARLLLRLATNDEANTTAREAEDTPRVVWTLPAALRAGSTDGRSDTPDATSYLEAAVSLIDGARDRVVLVSPYVEARGVGLLFERLADAMARGAKLVLVTHEASDLGSVNSHALEEMRRAAARVGGDLTVFSAGGAGAGGNRTTHPLLHAKMVIVDEKKVLLGSANLTQYGLRANLEAGTVLGREAAAEAASVTDALVESGLVRRAFSTTRYASLSSGSGCGGENPTGWRRPPETA